MGRTSSTGGFSVIEALVAIAIVGVTLTPIVEMQSQLSREYRRQLALEEELRLKRNALALLARVNVMIEPRGSREIGGEHRLIWTAAQLTPEKRALEFLSGERDFDVALFQVRAEVVDGTATPIAAFNVDKLGWRPHRDR